MSDLSIIIKKWRQYLGLSQRDFAEKVGCSLKSVNDWERERIAPYQFTLHKIAKSLKVDYQDFIKGPKDGETEPVFNPVLMSNSPLIDMAYFSPIHALSGIYSTWDASEILGFRMYGVTGTGKFNEYHFVYVDVIDFDPCIPHGATIIIRENPASYEPDDRVLTWDKKHKQVALVAYSNLKKTSVILGKLLRVIQRGC